MMHILLTLAQNTPPPPPPPEGGGAVASGAAGAPVWQLLLENALALTILFIFLTALVTVILSQRRRDKCLKFFHDYHITFLSQAGKAIWGDLIVYSKGLEVLYDAPYRTQRGIYKTSSLLYDGDVTQCLAVCRMVDALNEGEKRERQAQVRRTFAPNLWRRFIRRMRNLINMLRDAFSKALSALVGAWAQTSKSAAITSQKAGIEQIGQTILGVAGNAYEPLLERHIGKPVVLQMQTPASDDKTPIDVPGYLADYTETYLAVFNVEHAPLASETLTVTGDTQGDGYAITWTDQAVVVCCTGPDALVVRSYRTQERLAELDVVLLKGCKVALTREAAPGPGDSVELKLERTRRIDVVCPRSQAIVYFGGEQDAEQPGAAGAKAHGLAPVAGEAGD